MKNIELLIANDFIVKVNVVVMRDLNEHEIPAFIQMDEETIHSCSFYRVYAF